MATILFATECNCDTIKLLLLLLLLLAVVVVVVVSSLLLSLINDVGEMRPCYADSLQTADWRRRRRRPSSASHCVIIINLHELF
jgi:hypothetical protein